MFQSTRAMHLHQRLCIISQFLKWVLALPARPCDAPSPLSISAVRFHGGITVRGIIMSTTLHIGRQFTASITPRDDDGHAVPVDGVPVWASEGGLVELEPFADGLSCLIRNHDSIGTDAVTVTADADLGEGVVQIVARLELDLAHPQATSLDLVTSAEELIAP